MSSSRAVVRAVVLVLLACPAALLLAAPAASGQQDFKDTVITTESVAGGISMLQGRGGNIGVSAGPDGLLIVDDQFEPLADRILTALDALDGDQPREGKPRYVLNTHWHSDHTGGNAVFGRDGIIVAHAAVRARLAVDQVLPGRTLVAAPPVALPEITFADSVSLHFNGEEVRVIHFPHGHTDGDSIVWFTGSKVAHLGDLFFTGHFPFVDLNSGGDVQGYARNVAAVLALLPPDVKLIPGHGPLSTRADLEAYDHMLTTTIAIVRGRRSTGATQQDIVAEGLPPEWATWSWEFVDTAEWLTTICTSLDKPVNAEAPDFSEQPASTGDAAAPGAAPKNGAPGGQPPQAPR